MKNSPLPSSHVLSRRDFLARTGLLAAAAGAAPAAFAAQAASMSATAAVTATAQRKFEIGLLEKWFFDGGDGGPLKYTPDEMAQTLDEIGLDLELTLRKNGHITPEKAPDELPV